MLVGFLAAENISGSCHDKLTNTAFMEEGNAINIHRFILLTELRLLVSYTSVFKDQMLECFGKVSARESFWGQE